MFCIVSHILYRITSYCIVSYSCVLYGIAPFLLYRTVSHRVTSLRILLFRITVEPVRCISRHVCLFAVQSTKMNVLHVRGLQNFTVIKLSV